MFSRLWLSAFTLTDTAHINTLYRQKMAGRIQHKTRIRGGFSDAVVSPHFVKLNEHFVPLKNDRNTRTWCSFPFTSRFMWEVRIPPRGKKKKKNLLTTHNSTKTNNHKYGNNSFRHFRHHAPPSLFTTLSPSSPLLPFASFCLYPSLPLLFPSSLISSLMRPSFSHYSAQ